jgi:hypothetical protein
MLPLEVITTAAGCSMSACAAMFLSVPLPPAAEVAPLLLDWERLRALAAAAAAAAGSTRVMPMFGELEAEPAGDTAPAAAAAVGEPLGLLLTCAFRLKCCFMRVLATAGQGRYNTRTKAQVQQQGVKGDWEGF